MKRILTYIFFTMLAITANAQTAGDMFVSMPDTMLPYFNKAHRRELLSLKALDMTEPAVMQNVFSGIVALTTLSSDRLVVSLNEGTTLEIVRLPNNPDSLSEPSDSVYAVMRTVSMPEAETSCCIYNKVWKPLSAVTVDDSLLVQRPDTMTENEFSELLKMIEFPIIEMHSTDAITEIQTTMNVPFVTNADKERLKAILMQRKLKWNGKTFK